MIVPTGVGACIGGFAGDALPVARTLSSVVDCLITHPNVIISSLFKVVLVFFTLRYTTQPFKKHKLIVLYTYCFTKF